MNLNFTKRTKTILAGRHEPEGMHRLSNFYWRALLVTFLILVLVVLVYGLLGLVRILHGVHEEGSVSSRPSSALDRAALKTVIEGFEHRQSDFDLLKANRGKVIPDPSR